MIPATKALRDEMQHATDMAILAHADLRLKDALDDYAAVLARTTDTVDLETLHQTLLEWLGVVMKQNGAWYRRVDVVNGAR